MKPHFLLKMLLIGSLLLFSFQRKNVMEKSAPASAYSAVVLNKWMALQIRLMSTTPHRLNGPFVRGFSYSGLAAYFSVVPGIPPSSAFWFSGGRLSNLPALPEAGTGEGFHWPSSLNAALGSMSRSMFPAATTENKKAIDSLETALGAGFTRKANAATLQRSAQYGQQVAQAVFAWAEIDGSGQARIPVTLPGKRKWVSTPPDYIKPYTPYWGNVRTMVPGSLENAEPPVHLPYSEDSTSAFYKQAKEIVVASQNLTSEQKKATLFWREGSPGLTMPGHWLNVLRQLIEKENLSLDKAAFAYALTGMALNDAWIGCSKARYQHNLGRPVTYIREVLGHKDWLSLLPTWPNPDYPAMSAVAAGAVCTALAKIFGDDYTFTDHSYDDKGLGPRTYHSFTDMAREAGMSKILAGIHYRFSIEAGLQQGRAVAGNVLRLLLQKEKH